MKQVHKPSYSLTTTGRNLFNWMVSAGLPVPKTVPMRVYSGLAVVLAIAVASGEKVSAPKDAPGYPIAQWLTQHKDEVRQQLEKQGWKQ
jgi:hypothetical protein